MTTGYKIQQIGGYEVDLIDVLLERADFSDGTLYASGLNSNGGLGDNTTTQRSTLVQESHKRSFWKSISAGSYHSVAIDSKTGLAFTVGNNTYGQLGDNSITHKSTWVKAINNDPWRKVVAGQDMNVGIQNDGSLWAWGRNTNGELGVNNTSGYSTPVAISLEKWIDVSTCTSNQGVTCAIKSDGTMWCWGDNTNGAVGTSTASSFVSSPVSVDGGITDWVKVFTKTRHVLAIRSDGSLWAWGYNVRGQLGTGNTSSYSSPVSVIGGGKWRSAAVGADCSHGIKEDGTLWAWGMNSDGRLGGVGSASMNISSPLSVTSGGLWKHVSSTVDYCSVGVKTDGTLWVWGWNRYGLLGVGGSISAVYTTPTAGPSGSIWKTVELGTYHALFLKDQTLY